MKTKEEIIKSNPVLNIVLTTAGVGAYNQTYKAMDEYAKQQAIEFDKWKSINGYALDNERSSYIKLILNDGLTIRYEVIPTDTVYNQFIESQKQ